MITDGKPSCLKMPDGTYYKNSVGLDNHIVEKMLQYGAPITQVKNPDYYIYDCTGPLLAAIHSNIH